MSKKGKNRYDALQERIAELEGKLATCEQVQSSEVGLSFADGWNSCLNFMDKYFTPANDSNLDLGVTMGLVWGIAIGARGVARRELLLAAANFLAFAISDLDMQNGHFDQGVKEVLGLESHGLIDPTPALELREAVKQYYTGEDKNGLALASLLIQNMPTQNLLEYKMESTTKSGVEKLDVIDRLCERAKPYIDDGWHFTDTYDQLMIDLDSIELPTPDEAEELSKMGYWNVQGLTRAFNKRYRALP